MTGMQPKSGIHLFLSEVTETSVLLHLQACTAGGGAQLVCKSLGADGAYYRYIHSLPALTLLLLICIPHTYACEWHLVDFFPPRKTGLIGIYFFSVLCFPPPVFCVCCFGVASVAFNRNAVTRCDVRDVLMRRDASNGYNHHYSVKVPQVSNGGQEQHNLPKVRRAHPKIKLSAKILSVGWMNRIV